MVDTEQKLLSFLPTLREAPWVSVDTEADSLHAYPEKLCLIQISTPEGDRLVDPLASVDISPLLSALSPHELIMHGADYDLRLMSKHHDFVPQQIFDTMLAARLLGLRQFGLGSLVEQRLGVKLEKGPQKANWALRPLSERMEKYARNDTHYLKPLADSLRSELIEKGRLAWHKESCARLIQDATNGHSKNGNGDAAPWRIKGSNALSRAALATLRELWQWREEEAIAANRPPFFILSHDLLLAIAATAAEQRPIENLIPRHLSERRRQGITRAITKAAGLSSTQLPKRLRMISRRPTEGEKRRHQELQKRRDARAHELNIDPTIIASRGVISDLAHDWDKHVSDLMSWQRQLLA